MNLSDNSKNLLFVSFSPYFCAISWTMYLSISCEIAQKSDEKFSKNQIFIIRPLSNLHFEQNSRFSHWLSLAQIAYSPRVCRFAKSSTNGKIIECCFESEIRKRSIAG
jgi:hypothetical protein